MNQNQSPPLPEEYKLSKLGFNLNLIKFTKSLVIFGMILIPFMICSSTHFFIMGVRWYYAPLYAPAAIILLICVLFIVMIAFLKKRCDSEDIIGIEKIAVIASYFLNITEIIVVFSVFVFLLSTYLSGETFFYLPPVTLMKSKSLEGLIAVIEVTKMAAFNLHAVRTNNNSLLESYIIARYITNGLFFFSTMPHVIPGLVVQGSLIFWSLLSWNGLLIFNMGITLILQGIRNMDNEDHKNKSGQDDSIPLK